MTIYQWFQHSYSISPITLRHLPWRSSIKPIIIWLTKQIKIPKIVGTFLGKFPWWSLVFMNSQGNITEASLQHWHFSWKVSFFFSENPICRAHGIVFFRSREAVLVLNRKLCCIVFQNLLTETQKKSCLEIPPKNMRRESSVLVKLQVVQPDQAVLL